MDPNSTPQTVAQAVQAATQQAQQAVSHASPAVQPPQTSQATTIDNLTCQWQGCGERCDSAEALYDHVCERHVGRKSTNNLNLTCQWGACRTTTVKRDHITSHIRVHVPLKPHKCDFCGKAFKRPQDLKKHVKTHADDSVIMNSPQGQNGRGLGANGLGQQNGKPPAYYSPAHDTSLSNHYPGYQASMTTSMTSNGVGHSFPQAAGNGQYAPYGSVSYPNSSAVADIQSMDTRRRAIEALNDFLGDIKRRAIDPGNYYDVGQRLHSNALPLPVGTGYNTGYNNSGYTNANNNHNFSNTASLLESFNNGTHMGGHGGPQGGLAAPTYSLPLPNARTKNDLQDIDRFLEQLQATVYEHSHHPTVAGGVQQTSMHAAYAGDHGLGGQHQSQYSRASNSPPTFQHLHSGSVGAFATDTPGSMSSMSAASPGDRTPGLTPSSQSSYTSGHSPMSSHSQVSFGSPVDHTYPNLPPVTGISDVDSSYLGTTSAPASGLSTDLSGHGGRLHTGGYLQKEPRQSAPDMEMMDVEEDGARTPRAGVDADRPKSKGNSALDPALRGDELMESASTPTAQSEGVDDKRQEEWVENIRVIEALRKWIGERLNTGDFDEAEAAALQDVKVSSDIDMKTVETAKMVAEQLAGEEKAANESHPIGNGDDDVSYPTLPTA